MEGHQTSCLGRAAVPVKRVWRGLSTRLLRLRRRRTTAAGLGRLRKEVRTCEYSDVHVMWEMLSNTTGGGRKGKEATTTRPRPRAAAAAAAWSRLASYCSLTY